MSDNDNPNAHTEAPIEIDPKLLSAEALRSVIEAFVLREGTNYGDIDYTLEEKVLQVQKQIQKGDVKIVFDQVSESVTLITETSFSYL